jgi:hypothetical protein
MDQQVRDRIQSFVGGELEIQNAMENYAYRGPIQDIVVDDEGTLRVTFIWQAKSVDEMGNNSQYPRGGWVREERNTHNLSLELSPMEGETAPTPLASFSEIGEGRLVIHNPYVGELLTLFPQGGSQLDPSEVRGLL